MSEPIQTLFAGFGTNLQLFALTLALALPLGLIITLGSMTRFWPIKWLTKTFVWIIRGSPLMLQLFVVLYVPGLLFDYPMRNRMMAALVAFVINYAAYFSEIYRGGIESISKGQYEAGEVLGMTRVQVFFRVILLQVIKRITPSLGNEVITLVKDTALAQVIGVSELFRAAQNAASREFSTMPIFVAGVFYFIMNWVVSAVFLRIEKKLDYYK